MFDEAKTREQLIREIQELRLMLEAEKEERQVLSAAKKQKRFVEIQEREEVFRMLLLNMSEGFALGEPVLDEKGHPHDFTFTFINQAFEKQSGLSGEILGKPMKQVLPGLEREWIDIYTQVALSGESVHFENYNKDLDRYFEVNCYSPFKGHFAIHFTDVTKYKKIEEELRQANGLLSGITHGTEDMIAAQDHHFCYLFFNEAYRREFNKLWGRDIEIGTNMVETLTPWPAEQQKAKELWSRALNGESFQIMMEFGPPDGEKQFYDLRFNPVKDSSGNQIGAAHILRNVTEETKIREALRDSEEKYRSIFEQAAVGIGRVSFEDARLIDVNDTFSRMVGYSREELLQISWPEITHPDDLDLDLIPFREMAAGKLEGYTVEKRFIHKNGQHVWARLTLSLVRNAQGNADYEIAIIEDINERRQMQDALRRSEERWNLALENIEAGAIIATEEEQVIYWNPAARELHGFTSPSEGLGPLEETPITFHLWTPDRRHKLELDEWPMRRIKRGETVHGYELRLRRPDQGWEKYVSYSGSMVETIEGDRLIFLTLYDLTELRNRTEELVAVNRELEAFSYSVSHDLRAPLRTISGFSSLLRNHAIQLDDKADEYLQRIEAGAKKMNGLIDDMLRLSRISLQEMVIQDIDLNTMAKAAVLELEQQHPQRHVKFLIANELKARGDEQLLKIALINLLSNALKFTGKTAEASIEFGSYRTDGKKVFFIRDNGAGFPMEQADRIFLPFQRLHSESEFSGTGVGLPIVHRVISRHGGEIWAEGEVGKGATFYFTLGS